MGAKRSPNPKHQAFIAHYLKTFDATASAKAAGYSEKSAQGQGYQLLQHPAVSAEIKKAIDKRAKRLELSADNVLREIARVAFSDITNVMDFGPGGVTVNDSKTMRRNVTRAIQSVEETVSESETRTTRKIKVKLHDKLKALDLAGRHLGLWKSIEESDEFRQMTLDQLHALIDEAKAGKL
jgi:phage terminase small subunit